MRVILKNFLKHFRNTHSFAVVLCGFARMLIRKKRVVKTSAP